MDIYDELEQLVPQERKEAFLRLSRQLKEYGDHNPELLRIVEAMGFLSLYTHELPKRLSDTITQARAQLSASLSSATAFQSTRDCFSKSPTAHRCITLVTPTASTKSA